MLEINFNDKTLANYQNQLTNNSLSLDELGTIFLDINTYVSRLEWLSESQVLGIKLLSALDNKILKLKEIE